MIEMQLYIQNQRVDTFTDESVTLTDSIQNVRDFEKIFTSFSQSFNLPASKTNNKIFKHYYNFNIETDYSYDARVKTPANIELNSLPFRKGYIKLEGVDLKENIPYSYRITFFGEIVKLKDAIGEKKLSDLLGLGSVTYNPTTMLSYLNRDATTPYDEVVPLITHTQRLYYDSSQTTANTGNLFVSTNLHGVKWNELKPAMRVNKIIRAIETTFPQLEFTDDFFKNTSVPKMDRLFLWLSRKSGAVENLSGTVETDTEVPWNSGTSPGNVFSSSFNEINLIYFYDWQYVTDWRYTFNYSSGGSYVVRIEDLFGQTVYQSATQTGNLTIYKNDLNLVNQAAVGLKAIITTSVPTTFSSIQWYGAYSEYDPYQPINDSWTRTVSNFTTAGDFLFDYAKQMPDITIINFLSGLFRMFNLTAYVQDDGKIKVQPLDEYFENDFTYRDITEYVGIEKSTVNAALPYRQVKFEFSDTKSFLAQKFGEINNRAWGLQQYNNNQNDLTGSLYKVTAPFGHFLYERLSDANGGGRKNIQWGWSVDKSQNAMLPQPLLFYPVNPVEDADTINFIDEVDQDNNPTSRTTAVCRSMPMNTYASTPATGNNFQLNFTAEVNEWTGQSNFNTTLFSSYRKYILSIFNPKQRITNVEVMLPLAVLLQIQMNDRIIIAGNNYKINKLTTNLSTGKSQLELINDYTIQA